MFVVFKSGYCRAIISLLPKDKSPDLVIPIILEIFQNHPIAVFDVSFRQPGRLIAHSTSNTH
jgi:hypothetical protein